LSRDFVTSTEDADLGEKLILVIEGEKQTLDTTIFDSLDKYENQKKFFLYQFIETANGKIKRKKLQLLFEVKLELCLIYQLVINQRAF
jgi:O-succinylbenzoic acid--CoA ligase